MSAAIALAQGIRALNATAAGGATYQWRPSDGDAWATLPNAFLHVLGIERRRSPGFDDQAEETFKRARLKTSLETLSDGWASIALVIGNQIRVNGDNCEIYNVTEGPYGLGQHVYEVESAEVRSFGRDRGATA